MFSLSVPCELFIFTVFYCLFDLSYGECNIISLYCLCFSVNGSVSLMCGACLTVFVNCLGKQFVISLGVVAILLLNVSEVLGVGEGALCWIVPSWSSKDCMCCAYGQGVHIDVPSPGFVCVCVCSSFRSLRAGSQVFGILMLFLCVIFHTMWSDKSLKLLCILHSGILCLSAIRMMFVKIILAVYMLVSIMV